MIIEDMPVSAIVFDNRKRSLDTAKVDELVASIQKIGLRTPITVRIVHDRMGDDGIMYLEIAVLVTGRHRLEAARLLGWDQIPSLVSDGTETEAKLWEIAENLHRADLTVLERSEHIAEWIRLNEEDKANKAQVEPLQHPRGRPDKGINAAVRDLGIERNEAQRAVKINGIPEEVKEAVEKAGLADNQSALLQVAAEPSPEAQLKAIKQKKDHDDEAKKRNREAKKRRQGLQEEHYLEWKEAEKARAECVQNAARFLVSKLGSSGVIELFRLLDDVEISSLGSQFHDGDWSAGSPRLLTEQEIEERFGGGSVS